MKKILFVYRFNYLKEVLPYYKERGRAPTEFLYGLSEMNEEKFDMGCVNAPQGSRNGWHKLFWLIEWLFCRLSRFGMPLEIFPMFRKELRSADVIFCVNDAISCAILFWKRLGFIKGDVYALIQSAHERCHRHFRLRWFTRLFVGWLLRDAARVFTLADCARQPLTDYFGIDPLRVSHHPFVVDTDFWTPNVIARGQGFVIASTGSESGTGSAKPAYGWSAGGRQSRQHSSWDPSTPLRSARDDNNYILSIGNDFNREYDTLASALPFSQRAIFITTKPFETKGKIIETKQGLTNEQVRDYYRNAAAVVISSRALKYESSGFSCALQAAACESPLIISDSPPMRELFRENEHCLFYEPENVESLREKIEYVLSHPEEMKEMGKRGRGYVIANRTPAHAAKHLSSAISSW